MKLPITGWKKTLGALGYKVLWDNVRQKKRKSNSELQQPHRYESLEPRKLLANDLFINVSASSMETELSDAPLTLNFEAPEADVPVDFWEIDWGYGDLEAVAGAESSRSHVYSQPGEYNVVVTAHFEDGRTSTSKLALDSSFGDNGQATTDFFGGADSASSVVVQPDGKVLVGGTVTKTEQILDGGTTFSFGGSESSSTVGRKTVFGSEFFPVDANASSYRISVDASSGDGAGGAYNTATKHYLGFAAYDIDKKFIHPFNFYKHSSATDTRLAVDLNPGDTTITLEDATGWYEGGTEHIRTIAFYGYADSTGHVYEDYSYTRNYKRNLWNAGAINGNVITLRSAWTGDSIEAGRAVRNTRSAGTYNYALAAYKHIGEETVSFSAVIGGGRGQTSYSGFRPGTAYVRPMALANYRNAGDNQLNLSNFRIDPVSEYENRNLGIIRLNQDGTPDQSFGDAGKVSVDFRHPSSTDDIASSMALQDDGKIIHLGRSTQPGRSHDFALVRHNTDGSIDESFGNDGLVLVDPAIAQGTASYSYDTVGTVKVVGDSIFVSGAKNSDFVVIKLDLDGNLDQTFGADNSGVATIDFAGAQDLGRDLVVQSDGSIVVAGEAVLANGRKKSLVRLTPDGVIDTSFGPDGTGKVSITSAAVGRGLLVDENDNLFVTGYSYADVAKLTPDGLLDNTFGTNGVVQTDFGSGIGSSTGLRGSLQSDGKILLAGRVNSTVDGQAANKFAALRLLPNGSLDATFGNGGKLVVEFPGQSDSAFPITFSEDGIFVAGATNGDNGFNDFAITKLLTDNRVSSRQLEVSTALDVEDGNFSSGNLSLREALSLAGQIDGHNTITFAAGLGDITLSSALSVDSHVNIVGPGADQLTIDANQNGGIFSLGSDEVAISGLTLTGASSYAISSTNGGTVAIDQVEITENFGGVTAYGSGSLTITNSSISENFGTAISTYGNSVTLNQVTISNNSSNGSSYVNSGVSVTYGQLAISNSTIVGNRSQTGSQSPNSSYTAAIKVQYGASATIHNSIIAGNVAGAEGW